MYVMNKKKIPFYNIKKFELIVRQQRVWCDGNEYTVLYYYYVSRHKIQFIFDRFEIDFIFLNEKNYV